MTKEIIIKASLETVIEIDIDGEDESLDDLLDDIAERFRDQFSDDFDGEWLVECEAEAQPYDEYQCDIIRNDNLHNKAFHIVEALDIDPEDRDTIIRALMLRF